MALAIQLLIPFGASPTEIRIEKMFSKMMACCQGQVLFGTGVWVRAWM